MSSQLTGTFGPPTFMLPASPFPVAVSLRPKRRSASDEGDAAPTMPDNNRLGSDHGKLKQRIRPVRGFQSQKTAHNAIRGFETMRMFRKGQFRSVVDSLAGGSAARFIERLFRFFFA